MPLSLPQTITYWLSTGSNGTGGKTWAVGKVVTGRIASVGEEFFTDEGKKIWGNQAVYATVLIPEGSYIVEGDHESVAAPIATARQVIKTSTNPTMSTMNKMLLQ